MSKSDEPIFKCPNDIKVNVSKYSGEVILDEECCTAVSVILKNSGEIATSFFGAHNPEVVKILDKTLRIYFKSIKKTLKSEFKKQSEEEIKVVSEDLPEKDKWNGQPVPDIKEKKEVKKPSSKKTQNKKNTVSTGKKTINKNTTKNTTKKSGTKAEHNSKQNKKGYIL